MCHNPHPKLPHNRDTSNIQIASIDSCRLSLVNWAWMSNDVILVSTEATNTKLGIVLSAIVGEITFSVATTF